MTIAANILQIINAVLLIIAMALQTEKAEQGGVMGIGGAGGRQSGSVDVMVGPERILKPLTRWCAVGILFSTALANIKDVNFGHFAGALAVYLVVMLYGNTIWKAVTHPGS